MNEIQRRAFMQGAALGALTFTVGGVEVMLTPREAHAQNIPLRTLTPEQGATLDAVGETLVPGAKAAGVTNFVDQQISVPAEQSLLQARILSMRPPYANFYRAALGAIDNASTATQGQEVRRAYARRAARLHQPDAAEQDRRLAGAAVAVCLQRAAR